MHTEQAGAPKETVAATVAGQNGQLPKPTKKGSAQAEKQTIVAEKQTTVSEKQTTVAEKQSIAT